MTTEKKKKINLIEQDSVLSASPECLLVPYIHFGWLTVRVKHTYLPKEIYFFHFFRCRVLRCGHRYRRGRIFEAKFCLGRGRSRDPPDPQKPRFWACQKVVPPPCKNVQKMGFLGEKACIFVQFVHNFAQK